MSRAIHTKKGTYRKANIALGLSTAGLIVAFPFQNAFWGGLITSGCSAALVGGLADWFAVNALFRRPLGVKPGRIFRTEIIPRNRDRIYRALSDMVQNELLSQEALKNKLTAYDFSSPLLKIWEAKGRKGLEEPLTEFLQAFLSGIHLEVADLDREFEQVLGNKEFYHKELYEFLGRALERMLESGEGKRAAEVLMENLALWAQSAEVHHWLSRWIEYSITRYVNENSSRKFLTMFLPQPAVLSTKLQAQLIDYLRSGSPVETILDWVKKMSLELHTLALQPSAEIPQYLIFLDQTLIKLLPKAQRILVDLLHQKQQAPESASQFSRFLLNQVEIWTTKLQESSDERRKFNTHVQASLLPLVKNQHERIGKIVHEGLERYTDEMLVELIESKSGEDLQMIRINGSVVGGLVGMLIFILNIFLR